MIHKMLPIVVKIYCFFRFVVLRHMSETEAKIHKGLVVYRGDDCEANLYSDRFCWENISNPSKKGVAKFENTYGAAIFGESKKKPGFVIYGISSGTSKKQKTKKVPVEIEFITASKLEAEEWVKFLRNTLKKTWFQPEPRKPIFIIVNPFSGEKKGTKLFENVVKPMLDSADVLYEVTETQRPGHATELAKQLKLDEWSAIATVSGDGLLHEVLQGLLTRNSWNLASKIPLALLPAGSGNGLMKSFESSRIEVSVFNLIKGYSEEIDILSVKLKEDIIYCHLAVFWGLMADADIESDRYRFVGPARFTVGAIVRVVNLRSYHGILRYLPSSSEPYGEIDSSAERPPHKFSAHEDVHTCPEGWTEIESDFIVFSASNVPWVATDVCIAPKAIHNDGFYDILWVDKKKVSKTDLAKLLLQIENGNHINHPGVNYEKVRAFSIIPTDVGIMDVDGEPISAQAFTAEVLPSLCKLIIPPVSSQE